MHKHLVPLSLKYVIFTNNKLIRVTNIQIYICNISCSYKNTSAYFAGRLENWVFKESDAQYMQYTIVGCPLMEYQFAYTNKTLFSIAFLFTRLVLIETSSMNNLIKTQQILGMPYLQCNLYWTVENLSIFV